MILLSDTTRQIKFVVRNINQRSQMAMVSTKKIGQSYLPKNSILTCPQTKLHQAQSIYKLAQTNLKVGNLLFMNKITFSHCLKTFEIIFPVLQVR